MQLKIVIHKQIMACAIFGFDFQRSFHYTFISVSLHVFCSMEMAADREKKTNTA